MVTEMDRIEEPSADQMHWLGRYTAGSAPKRHHDGTTNTRIASRHHRRSSWKRYRGVYFFQSCSSLKPSTSRILRFDKGASSSPISRLIGTFGHSFLRKSTVLTSGREMLELVALNTSTSARQDRRLTAPPRSKLASLPQYSGQAAKSNCTISAVHTWNPKPSFFKHRSQICPRSRASIYDHALRLRLGGSAMYLGKFWAYSCGSTTCLSALLV